MDMKHESIRKLMQQARRFENDCAEGNALKHTNMVRAMGPLKLALMIASWKQRLARRRFAEGCGGRAA